MKDYFRIRGSALILAIFVVAVVSIAAIYMATQTQFSISRSQALFNNSKSFIYSQGINQWAKNILLSQVSNPSNLSPSFPIKLKKIQITGGSISGEIFDAQKYFNLNNIATAPDGSSDPTGATPTDYLNGFIRILLGLNTNMTAQQISQLADSLADWVQTPTIQTSQTTGLNVIYMKRKPPYRAAHQMMADLSEFRLIHGITAVLYQKLSPYLIALPSKTPININTAPWQVLLSLSKKMTPTSAQNIASIARSTPYTSITAALNSQAFKNLEINPALITTQSNYFLVQATITLQNQTTHILTLLQRLSINNKLTIRTIWQRQGSVNG